MNNIANCTLILNMITLFHQNRSMSSYLWELSFNRIFNILNTFTKCYKNNQLNLLKNILILLYNEQ
jgi:hypothetical protein